MREYSYCHMREDRYGLLVIEGSSTWASLVSVPSAGIPGMNRVEPGEPAASYLWLKLTDQHLEAGGDGWMMPYFRLPGQDLDIIRSWIEQGAANH